ncbi:acyl-CoA dehydratase activase-related protein [Geosporobacter ferrireducens]|uniref:acyl-CoA dehydratase activase-related protein n=1 Tax=Geosporobacter ferrireducens TaxID=1424294 RepID=UPI00139E9F82|nr:acyl-CoA dehydratase activase-related protein [Geosporobacter ferrireducens]MTI55427.1 hypothetical protein [Geosporobacter ferrireducens]
MAIKVGIPRALLYYAYSPLWVTYFKELDAEVMISSKTNKKILDEGISTTVDEACIPIKLFHGHVMDLKDGVDVLFIPRITSIYFQEYICPKFCGLPEMIQHSIEGLPPLITTEINFFKSQESVKNTIYEIGSFFTKDKKKMMKAFQRAKEVYESYRRQLQKGEIPSLGVPFHMYRANSGGHPLRKKEIMVMGHPYNLYDSYLNMDLFSILVSRNSQILTPEMIKRSVTDSFMKDYKTKFYWSFANRLIGAMLYLIEQGTIDGIIYISTFGCGVDSVVADIIEKTIREKTNIPFLLLTIDEHRGEAGFYTRVEAFMDMLEWRVKDENYVSPYGQPVHPSKSCF